MNDPTPPTPPTPTPTHTPSVFHQAQLAALNEADKICVAAQKPAYAPALAVREITAAEVTQLVADILTCRQTAAAATQSSTGKRVATDAMHTAETNLLTALHEVQAAARQKYARTNPTQMNDYMVGHRLNPNQATFKQSVQAIIKKLGSDTLPGITPAKVANLQTLLTAYTTLAANPDSKARTKLSSPSAESAPAASRTGAAGSGIPNCSTKTQPNSNRYPYVSKICSCNAIGNYRLTLTRCWPLTQPLGKMRTKMERRLHLIR